MAMAIGMAVLTVCHGSAVAAPSVGVAAAAGLASSTPKGEEGFKSSLVKEKYVSTFFNKDIDETTEYIRTPPPPFRGC